MKINKVNINTVTRARLGGYKLTPQSKPIFNQVAPVKEQRESIEVKSPVKSKEIGLTASLKEMFKLEEVEVYTFLTPEEKYFIDERAGIYEYEAGLSRAEAEGRALYDLHRNIDFKL